MGAAGWLAERLFERHVAVVRGRRPAGEGSLAAAAGHVAIRLVLDVLGLVAFGIAALAVFILAHQPHEPTRQLLVAALAGTLLVRLVARVGRVVLAPDDPAERLLPFGDAAARRLQTALVRLAGLFVASELGLGLLRLWGLAAEPALLLEGLLAVLFLAVFLRAVWASRADVAALIRGPEPAAPLRRRLADAWPLLVTAYVALVWLVRALEKLSGRGLRGHAGVASLLVVVALPLADMLLGRVLAAAFGGRAEGRAQYEPVLRRGVHIVVLVAGLLALARLWGLDLFALSTGGLGQRLTEALFGIAVTVLVAHLAWELVKASVDARLAAGGTAEGQPASRVRTVLPLVRAFVFVSVSVMAAIGILASLGVNVWPLLAGAGVVGVAIGFGAQTLVRDVISGLFFLLDDAFRLGEYIDVGDAKGTVERIGLRSMQLRHHRGALNTVPYGAIRRLVNQSRDWVIVKLEFRLTYDTDIVRVRKIIKRIGEELMQDPELGPGLLEPLKSQGIMAADDSALVVRAKFMARPTDLQWVIRREAYSRIVRAFAANGITFAHRQVTVFAPPAGDRGPSAAGAAAAAAVETPPARDGGA
jgi:small-conductance mechanosensitive channel